MSKQKTIGTPPGRALSGISLVLGCGILLVACLVLAGWVWNLPVLYSLVSGMPPMVPNTALGFLISSVSLLLLLPVDGGVERRLIGQLLALVCLLLGLFTLLEFMEVWSGLSALDEVLVGMFPVKPYVLRPSPHTAISFAVMGAALFLLGGRRKIHIRLCFRLTMVAMVVPVIALFGYFYDQTEFYRYTEMVGMSLLTAISFVMLSLGILMARPDQGVMQVVSGDTLGGRMVRRLLPAVILLPLILGGLILHGVRGKLYSSDLGVAVLQVITVLVLAGIIVFVAGMLNREETMRKTAEKELRRSEEKLRDFAIHLEKVREAERATVARDIHDEVGGMLSALKMDVGLLSSKLKQINPQQDDLNDAVNRRLGMTTEHIDLLMQTVRRIISNLRPSILDNLGLLDAIEWQLSEIRTRYGVQYNYDRYVEDDALRFADESHITSVFRIFQEITNNIVRHAKASMITVLATNIEGNFVLSVSDNGRGMPENQGVRADAFGLLSIQERANSMKGECSIISKKNFGTTVTVSIPLASGFVV